jgi:drug/metabolite transporter (DMT)-like permease
MINGATPIFATLLAAFLVRRLPSRLQICGLMLGFVGVVVVGWPALQGASSTALGAFLVLLATILYGVAINLAVPLQRRYGSLPVLLRAQLFALAFVAIPGLIALPDASFKVTSALAMLPLGVLGTGLAFVCMTTLVGRVGPSRGSITVYFVPLVAVALGPIVRDEKLELISLVGMVMVLVGAYLASRVSKLSPTEMAEERVPARA